MIVTIVMTLNIVSRTNIMSVNTRSNNCLMLDNSSAVLLMLKIEVKECLLATGIRKLSWLMSGSIRSWWKMSCRKSLRKWRSSW